MRPCRSHRRRISETAASARENFEMLPLPCESTLACTRRGRINAERFKFRFVTAPDARSPILRRIGQRKVHCRVGEDRLSSHARAGPIGSSKGAEEVRSTLEWAE